MSNVSNSGSGATSSSWLYKKVFEPFLQILRRGSEPRKLAFSAALGITLGLFPIVAGVTVFLCGLAIATLGHLVNAPTVMLANFVATPLELSLMVMFLRFGEFLTGGDHFTLTSNALKKVLRGEASMEIVRSILHALLGWLVLAPVILGILYIILLPCFVILVHKFGNVSSPKGTPSATELRLRVRDS